MYKIEIGGDASGFNAAAEGAKRSAQALEKALATTSKSGNPTKKALREVTNEAARLGAQLATMSAEQKRGAIGRQLQRDYEVAKQAAAQLTDLLSDLAAETKHIASDTANFDAFAQSFLVLGSGLSTLSSLYGYFSKNEKDAMRLMNLSQGIIQGTNFLIQTLNALQHQSSVMLGIKNMQTIAYNKAMQLEAANLGRVTIAQRLFNTVAKANPYVLLGTALLTLGGALTTYVALTSKAAKEEEKHKKQLERSKKAAKEIEDAYKNTYTQTLSQALAELNKFTAQWKNLGTYAEKVKWIKDNSDALDKLHISHKNVNEVQEAFTKNKAKVIETLKQQALAAAAAAKAEALYSKAMELRLKISNIKYAHYKEGDVVTATETRESVRGGSYVAQVQKKLSKEEAEARTAKGREEALAQAKGYYEEYKKLMAQGDKLFETYGSNFIPDLHTDESKNEKDIKPFNVGKWAYTDRSHKTLEIMNRDLEGMQKALNTTNDPVAIVNLRKNIKQLTEDIKKFKGELGTEPIVLKKIEISKLAMDAAARDLQYNLDHSREKQLERTSEKFSSLADSISTLGEAFRNAGADAEGFKLAMGALSISASIATVVASFAKALGSAKTWWEWLAFGASGLATLGTIVGTIKSMKADTYAEGGIVQSRIGSAIGDKNLARVNGGEMILNNRQQSNLFRLLDRPSAQGSGTMQYSHCIVQGTDLDLVFSNLQKQKHLRGIR